MNGEHDGIKYLEGSLKELADQYYKGLYESIFPRTVLGDDRVDAMRYALRAQTCTGRIRSGQPIVGVAHTDPDVFIWHFAPFTTAKKIRKADFLRAERMVAQNRSTFACRLLRAGILERPASADQPYRYDWTADPQFKWICAVMMEYNKTASKGAPDHPKYRGPNVYQQVSETNRFLREGWLPPFGLAAVEVF